MTIKFFLELNVVYFDQQMGVPHAVHWSKSIFNAKTTFGILFVIECIK